MEPDRPQHDGVAACVIAQQYSSATFAKPFGPAWKNSKRCPKRSPIQYFTFLGALAKLRKATISFLMPLRLSVRPSVRMK